MKTRNPVLDIGLFSRNRVFAFSNLAALINYSATAAVGFLLSLYLQYIKGLTPQQAGFVLIAQPVMQALFSPLAGRLSTGSSPGSWLRWEWPSALPAFSFWSGSALRPPWPGSSFASFCLALALPSFRRPT